MSYDRPSPMRKVSDSARRLVRNPSSYQDKTTIVAQILLDCRLILICHGSHTFIYQKRLRPLTSNFVSAKGTLCLQRDTSTINGWHNSKNITSPSKSTRITIKTGIGHFSHIVKSTQVNQHQRPRPTPISVNTPIRPASHTNFAAPRSVYLPNSFKHLIGHINPRLYV